MTEEVPKNYAFLKFIVIFMGVLIVLGLGVVVWKIMDLAKQKAARAKTEAITKELNFNAAQAQMLLEAPFAFDLPLESRENILEISSTPGGIWIRIGKNGMTDRMILIDYAGKVMGTINVKQGDEELKPAQ